MEAQDENENLKEEIEVLKVQLREIRNEVNHLKSELAKYTADNQELTDGDTDGDAAPYDPYNYYYDYGYAESDLDFISEYADFIGGTDTVSKAYQEYCEENVPPVDPFFETCDPTVDWKLLEENGIDPDTKKKAPRPKKKSTPEGEK